MTQPTTQKDVWAAGALYEPYVGRWSRKVAPEFLEWLGVPEGKTWLDVGCGTGALSESILRHCNPRALKGIDPSAGFVDYASARLHDPRAHFAVGDARTLPHEPGAFDAAVAGLVLNFVPEPSRALAEMARVARPRGVVAAYVWDYAGKMELMRYFWDAAAALDPQASSLDEGRRFPLCNPDRLCEVFAQAGLQEIDLRAIDVATEFKDFDDYWTPFLGGQGPAPGYAMSLDEPCRLALRDSLRSALPVGSQGSIHLIARAWAVRGVAPG